MPYVMVPVPEEHVEDVMQFILRAIARAAIEPWDADAIRTMFDEVDEASRSLLAFVARARLDGNDLSDTDAARRIQITVRETMGIINELNSLARDADRPALITVRVVPTQLPNGRTVDTRVFQMEPDTADFVSAAEQADLMASGHPLGEDVT